MRSGAVRLVLNTNTAVSRLSEGFAGVLADIWKLFGVDSQAFSLEHSPEPLAAADPVE